MKHNHIQNLESKRLALLEKAKALEIAISVLREVDPHRNNSNTIKTNPSGYVRKNKPSIADKAISYLKEQNHFLTKYELIQISQSKNEPFESDIASSLSIEKSMPNSILINIKHHGLFFWGLKHWIDENGQPIEDFIFKK